MLVKNILNVQCIVFYTFVAVVSLSCSAKKEDPEWRPLFNGKDLSGWIPKIYHHELGDNYANTFRVEDGAILVSYDQYESFDNRYGHLFYQQNFSSFHLKFEYRFTDEWLTDAPDYTYRNSGIMFHAQSPESILKEQDWPISVEYQILAEEEKGVDRPTGNMCSPGTDVVFNYQIDPRHCISSNSKTYDWNRWIEGELIVYSDSLVIHLVEGDTVLKYTNPQIGGGVTTGYDPEIKVDGRLLFEGYIGLQSEGQGIKFKNIEIKEF